MRISSFLFICVSWLGISFSFFFFSQDLFAEETDIQEITQWSQATVPIVAQNQVEVTVGFFKKKGANTLLLGVKTPLGHFLEIMPMSCLGRCRPIAWKGFLLDNSYYVLHLDFFEGTLSNQETLRTRRAYVVLFDFTTPFLENVKIIKGPIISQYTTQNRESFRTSVVEQREYTPRATLSSHSILLSYTQKETDFSYFNWEIPLLGILGR